MIWNHYSIQSHTFLFFLSMFIVYWWFPHWAPHSKIRHYSYRNSEHHFNWSNISQAFKIFTLYNSHFLQWIFKKIISNEKKKKRLWHAYFDFWILVEYPPIPLSRSFPGVHHYFLNFSYLSVLFFIFTKLIICNIW